MNFYVAVSKHEEKFLYELYFLIKYVKYAKIFLCERLINFQIGLDYLHS